MWKSAPEVEVLLNAVSERLALGDLWALHYFAEYTVFSLNYETDHTWEQVITLSDAGTQLIELGDNLTESFTRADLHLAAFGRFYHHELLVDFEHGHIVSDGFSTIDSTILWNPIARVTLHQLKCKPC